MKLKDLAFAGLACVALAGSSQAATWTDWTSGSGATTYGTLDIDGTAVGVTVTGTVNPGFRQLSGGIDYYTGTQFDLGGAGIPTTDLIALTQAGTFTVTFSQEVTDIYFALVSWNVWPATFSTPVEVVSVGCGYWGCGSATPSPDGKTLSFTGEPHGLLKLNGTFSSFSFTTTIYENWHGFTVGADSLPAVPLPATGLLLTGAVGALAGLRRRRRGA